MAQFHLFLWLSNILLYTQLYPFIHQWIPRLFPTLTIINNDVMNMGLQISFGVVFSFPLDIFPEVKLLAHMVVLFFSFFKGPPYYFP